MVGDTIQPLPAEDLENRPMIRTLHALDLENLCQSSSLTSEDVRATATAYYAAVPMDDRDHIVLSVSHHNAFSAFFSWPGLARRLLGSGRDGADLQLIEVLYTENIPARFDRVVLGSGDGIFAPAVTWLRDQGVEVTIVARTGSISYHLYITGGVVLLPTIATVRVA